MALNIPHLGMAVWGLLPVKLPEAVLAAKIPLLGGNSLDRYIVHCAENGYRKVQMLGFGERRGLPGYERQICFQIPLKPSL